MSSPAFSFPPFHSFPPSFTRQPVASTLSKQSSLWCDLIRSFCRARRLFWLDLSSEAASALFENPSIGRRLSDADVLFFLDALVSRGDGQWSTDKRSCLVYWRRPSEWGELVYKYVLDTGQGGDVFTVHELRTKSEGYEFHMLEDVTFRRALESLQLDGKCHIFGGTTGDDIGVKFLT